MKVEFLDPAESEFIEAIGYYNGESEGLGYEFATEVNRTIGRIMEYPNAWAVAIETDSAVSDEPVPIWCHLPSPGRHDPDRCNHAPAPRPGILERSTTVRGALNDSEPAQK
jgi:hypothetical protein